MIIQSIAGIVITRIEGYPNLMIPLLLHFPFVGCTTEPPNVVETPLPACLDYAKDAELYGYCVYKNADALSDIASVNEHCPNASTWQDDCRQSWVMSHKDSYTLDDLMNICGNNADCAFQLLDSKPHQDVLEQVELCIRHADRYKHDCVMHAIQRWYFEWPDAEEVLRVAKRRNPFPEQIGTYIGARVACDGVGTCDGETENKRMCEKYVVEYQDKSKCPNQHRRRIKR